MNNILFISIPKNASTSLFEAFGNKNVISRRLNEYAHKIFNTEYCKSIFDPRHINIEKAVKYLGGGVLGDIKVCCVRNPYERIVSAYCFAVDNNLFKIYGKEVLRFNEFVKEFCSRKDDENFFHAHTQKSWGMFDGEFVIDNIIKFEQIQYDYEFFCWFHKLDLGKLPHRNKTRHADWRLFYDFETEDMVLEAYEEDFEQFNYEKEIEYEKTYE